MESDLEMVGITTQERYECIYTTIDENKNKNAAAIGFKYIGGDKVACRLFENSQTFKNIKNTQSYVINITQDPLIFTKSTISRLSEDDYTDDEDTAILKNAGSYIIVDVDSMIQQTPDDTPIKNGSGGYLIKGTIREFVVNDESIKAYNRGFSALIECLVNYTRYGIVDDNKKEYYIGRLDENERMISRIANDEIKESMKLLRKAYEDY